MSRRQIELGLDVTTGMWLRGSGTAWNEALEPILYYREELLLLITLLYPNNTGGYDTYTSLDADDVLKATVDDNYDSDSEPYVRANDWYVSKTVTMTDIDDKVNCVAHGYQDGRPVWFHSTGSLPSNITAYTTYYVINAAADDFQIAATVGGAAIDFGSDSTAVTTAFYGTPAINVPGDWNGSDADQTAGELSIRLDANTLQFRAAVDSFSNGEKAAYFEIQIYPAGGMYMSGVIRSSITLRTLIDLIAWEPVDAADYTATPASGTTVTMLTDLTAEIEVGAGLRFLINNHYYFATVDTLTAGLLTITGATLPQSGGVYYDIDDFQYEILPDNVAANYLTAVQVTALLATMVSNTLFDANTILKADTDNTPEAMTVAEDTLIGRRTGQSIEAISSANVKTMLDILSNSLFDAYTILAATVDNTPAPLTVGEGTIVGRRAGQPIEAITYADLKTALDILSNSLFDAYTILAATADNTPAPLTVGEGTLVGRRAGQPIEAITYANLKTDLAWKYYETECVPAGSMIAVEAAAPTFDPNEWATYDVNMDTYIFTPASNQKICIVCMMPPEWDTSHLKIKFEWGCAGGGSAETTVWGAKALALGDGDTIDQDFGSEQTVSDTWIGNDVHHITEATAHIAASNTPAGGKKLVIMITCKDTSTLTGTALLFGATIQWKISTTAPSAW